jgi:hypothetical protein
MKEGIYSGNMGICPSIVEACDQSLSSDQEAGYPANDVCYSDWMSCAKQGYSLQVMMKGREANIKAENTRCLLSQPPLQISKICSE